MDPLPFINLFSGRTRVTLINATTGKLIGVQKMKSDQLPVSFNKPTFIDYNGAKWRVMKAEPIHANQYKLDNKLTLHIENPSVGPQQLGNNYPTISGEYPRLTELEPIFNDFCLDIPKDQWQQFEFIPTWLLTSVQEEIGQIVNILSSPSNVDNLRGYFDIHVRKGIRREPLKIPFDLFCEQLNIQETGSIRIGGSFIENGIALRSDNYTYYGIAVNNIIEELSMEIFESADEEFFQVASAFNLLLADWCNAKIIMI